MTFVRSSERPELSAGFSIAGLSIWRPWSWLISHGPKRIENRRWRPPARAVGRWLALHATNTYDLDALHALRGSQLDIPSPLTCPRGIVAVARLAGFVESEDAAAAMAGADQVEWYGRPPLIGWVLADVVRIDPPIVCRGAQGLWPLPPAVLAAVRAKYRSEKKRHLFAPQGSTT